jgi:hypothetical protein
MMMFLNHLTIERVVCLISTEQIEANATGRAKGVVIKVKRALEK